MRRQQISTNTFSEGFSDSVNKLTASPYQFAEGSTNQQTVGAGAIIPFRGLYTKGAGSGVNYATALGSTWGGLSNYSSISAQGSILEDFSKTIYLIGSGKANKAGTLLQLNDVNVTISAINTGTGVLTSVAHGLLTGQAVYLTASTYPLGTSAATPYWVTKIDADTFKLSTSYFNCQAGTFLTGGTAGTGTIKAYNGGTTGSVIDGVAATTLLQALSVQVADYFYTYQDQAGLSIPDTPTVAVPNTPSGSYTGLINGAVNFKIAGIRDRQNVGANITTPDAPVKSVSSAASAVVVPNNKTVQITFPTAKTGQTHWAVFSTQEGFGGTGNFFRLGYRTSSDATATWIYGIPETTVAAAVGRTLEFDYRSGDLLPETAWLEDYSPPAGSHCVRLENIMVVLGCSDGTVGAVSLPNFFESYNPFHLLYFPEPVTAVLHRQVDNYAFVACRNSIHAIQYVGYRGGNLPSATITTLNPEIGIAYQSNWALGGGNIACFVEGAGIALMSGDGTMDFTFGADVNRFTKDWTAANTAVSFNPKTRSFVFGNGDISLSFCMQTGKWSSPFYNSDAGVTGTWISGINARGEDVVTLTNGGTQTAYSFDDNTGTTRIPCVSVTGWMGGQDPARGKNIYEVQYNAQGSTNVEPIIGGLHQNLVKTYIRACSVSSSSATLTVPSWPCAAATVSQSWAAVSGLNIGNKAVSAIGTNTFTITNHPFVTGQSVTLTTSGALPTGLAISTTYYIIKVDANTISFATTLANTMLGTVISFTSSGSSGTQTVVCNFLIAKLTYVNSTTATMTDPYTGASLTSAVTLSPVFVLLGSYFGQMTPTADIAQHLWSLRPQLLNCRTFALSALQISDAATSGILNISSFGTMSDTSFVKTV
jgi:hypothetical protein